MTELPPPTTPLPGPRLTGRSALVTGAASGIGAATALRLAAEGATVLAVDLDPAGLQRTVAALPAEATGSVTAHVADVSDEDAVAGAVAAAVAQGGGLQVLANIAGMLRTVRTHECDRATWDRILAVNATGTFLLCKAALPHLVERGGAIVNAASTSGSFGHPWMAAYAASKGAVEAFTHTLAVEYCKQGVRVNAVAPGSVTSGITSAVEFPSDLTKDEGKLVRRIMSPTGFGRPEDVAAVVAMLASDDGAHVTGEVIRIDGGTHA